MRPLCEPPAQSCISRKGGALACTTGCNYCYCNYCTQAIALNSLLLHELEHEHAAGDLSAKPWTLTTAEDMQLACYTGGGFYRRHSDAQNATRRVLTGVYYVDTKRPKSARGNLRIHLPLEAEKQIAPKADRLVLFRSDLEHEVLPLAPNDSPRCAITQWFYDVAPPLIQSSFS